MVAASPDALRFDGQVAFITGAGRGLGRAYAEWLARRGATVIVNNRPKPGRESVAKAVADAIVAEGGLAHPDEAHIEDETEITAAINSARERFGRLDILICNAGFNEPSPLHQTPIATLRQIIDVNQWGTLLPVMAALPHFLDAGYGRIVTTTSAAALFSARNQVAYAAAKGAVATFTRGLANELRGTDVRINCVSPYALTEMSKNAIPQSLSELMAPNMAAPAVGWLSHPSCDRSGLILSIGAGRVRRVAFAETPVMEAQDLRPGPWPIDGLEGVVESRNSGRSAFALAPELVAAKEAAGQL